MTALPLSDAAKVLQVAPATLRRWVAKGCPSTPGGRGRGKGSRVSPEAVRAWREGKAAPYRNDTALRELACFALDFYRRGAEVGERGHLFLNIPDAKAAAYLTLFVEYVRTRGGDCETSLPDLELLSELARQGLLRESRT